MKSAREAAITSGGILGLWCLLKIRRDSLGSKRLWKPSNIGRTISSNTPNCRMRLWNPLLRRMGVHICLYLWVRPRAIHHLKNTLMMLILKLSDALNLWKVFKEQMVNIVGQVESSGDTWAVNVEGCAGAEAGGSAVASWSWAVVAGAVLDVGTSSSTTGTFSSSAGFLSEPPIRLRLVTRSVWGGEFTFTSLTSSISTDSSDFRLGVRWTIGVGLTDFSGVCY